MNLSQDATGASWYEHVTERMYIKDMLGGVLGPSSSHTHTHPKSSTKDDHADKGYSKSKGKGKTIDEHGNAHRNIPDAKGNVVNYAKLSDFRRFVENWTPNSEQMCLFARACA